jgi:hypothetical protein
MLSKYTNVFFPICSFVISLTVFLIFFSKKRIKTEEMSYYSRLVIVGLIESFIYSSICILAHIVDVDSNLLQYQILNKILYSIYIIWFTILFKYIFSICFISKEEKNNLNKIKNIFCIVFDITLILLIFFSDVEIFYNPTTGMSNSSGTASNILFTGVGIYIILMSIISFKNFKNNTYEKYIPLYLLLFLMVCAMFIRTIDPLFSIYSNVLSLVVLVMFFTIENPDLKMLEEYNKNRELAETGIEEKTNILFSITEDIRIPVKKIKSYGENALSSNDINIKDENLNKICQSSNNLINTIDDVLNVSTIDKNNVKFYVSSYDIYSLFDEIIHIVKNKFKNNTHFKYSIANTIPDKLYGDQLKLKQVICSLILNGATNDSTVDLDISYIVKSDVCRLIINVSNTSLNMSLIDINNILSSNIELNDKKLEELETINIDYYTIKKLIDLLNGTFLIKNDENSTTFTVILNQLIKKEKNDREINKLASKISNKKRVLLLDDNYKELHKISSQLKYNNFVVSSVMYIEDAIDKLINNEYDFIFVDDEMKENNAATLIKKIDELKLDNLIKIIMIDMNKENIKEHYIKDYSFVDYLVKDNYKEEIKRLKEKYK